jgi:hypothetical protein
MLFEDPQGRARCQVPQPKNPVRKRRERPNLAPRSPRLVLSAPIASRRAIRLLIACFDTPRCSAVRKLASRRRPPSTVNPDRQPGQLQEILGRLPFLRTAAAAQGIGGPGEGPAETMSTPSPAMRANAQAARLKREGDLPGSPRRTAEGRRPRVLLAIWRSSRLRHERASASAPSFRPDRNVASRCEPRSRGTRRASTSRCGGALSPTEAAAQRGTR